MRTWKSATSKFSRVPSWKSIEHLTLQTRLSIAHRKKHYKPPVESENATNEKVISGKWVLKPRKARYVLRDFEEDVKDEDVFASTIMTVSVRMLLSVATVLRSEGRTVFSADLKTAFLNAHMKDGDVVYGRPPPEWQPETLDPQQGHCDLETTEKSVWSQKRAETLAGPPGGHSQQVRLCLKHARHLPVDSPVEASVTGVPR